MVNKSMGIKKAMLIYVIEKYTFDYGVCLLKCHDRSQS